VVRGHRVLDLCLTVAAFVGAYFIKKDYLPLEFRGLTTDQESDKGRTDCEYRNQRAETENQRLGQPEIRSAAGGSGLYCSVGRCRGLDNPGQRWHYAKRESQLITFFGVCEYGNND
jgi:hypothetical protein